MLEIIVSDVLPVLCSLISCLISISILAKSEKQWKRKQQILERRKRRIAEELHSYDIASIIAGTEAKGNIDKKGAHKEESSLKSQQLA